MYKKIINEIEKSITEGAKKQFDALYAIASICYLWATIFYICQCEKWTKNFQKTVEISKTKTFKLCKMMQGAKNMWEKCKKIC